ncbi:MAG: DUF2520 domain-containing protein [Candidatus Dormiibacterota bacterium]
MTETEVGYGIVGAGRLGQALARRLARNGAPPGTLYSTSPERAGALAAELGWTAQSSAGEVVARARLTMLCVPDGALAPLVVELSGAAHLPERVVVHCAGSRGLEPLAALREQGCLVGVFHPLAPIPDGDPTSLEGTFISIESDPPARAELLDLACLLDCQVIEVEGLDRPLYHAAAVFAGVLPVLLESLAERLGEAAGGGPDVSRALRALYSASARNVERLGPERGLSGPLRRRDQGTVGAHLAALSRFDPALAEIYQAIQQTARPGPADHTGKEVDRG